MMLKIALRRQSRLLVAVLGLILWTGAEAQNCTPAPNPDLDNDGIVSAADLFIVTSHYGLQAGSAGFHPMADTNCNGIVDGDDVAFVQMAMGETFPAESSATVIGIDANRLSAVVGTEFILTGQELVADAPVQGWEWNLGDGRTASGKSISVLFSAAGIYPVTATATDADGNPVEAKIGLVVFDPNTSAPAELGLPERFGDVNGDGTVTLVDAHLAAKHASGLEPLPDDRVAAAELDFEDPVTTRDALLIARAVIDDQPLPSVLLPDEAQPGAVVTMISPALRDPVARFEVAVGESVFVQEVTRVALGYGTFMVPLDPTTANSIAVEPGPVEVRLLQDGAEVETFTLEIEAPPPIPDDPRARVKQILDRLEVLLQQNRLALEAQLDDIGLAGEERELMLASAIAAQEEAEAVFTGMRTLMEDPANEGLAELILRQLNANGLEELLEGIEDLQEDPQGSLDGLDENSTLLSTLQASPSEVCDEILPAYCTALAVAQTLDDATTAVSVLCNTLLVAVGVAVVVPADGPIVDAAALGAWLGLCAKAEGAISVANAVTGIVTKFDADLDLEVSPSALEAGETASLETSVVFAGIDDVCSIVGGEGAGAASRFVADRALNELLRRKIGRTATQKLFEAKGGTFLNDFLESLRSVTQLAVSEAGVSDAFQSLADSFCDRYNVGGRLTADASRILQAPEPNAGRLSFLADGTAEYQCPDPAAGGTPVDEVTFTAEKQICDELQTLTGTVLCAGGEVTITMGDNGSANDDIYEVIVDGETVLTSSVPVRSTSTTIILPAGEHTVRMAGRAAPDGIGTYYIRFSGDVSSVSGAATSGTDLTPGVVKTFVITVE